MPLTRRRTALLILTAALLILWISRSFWLQVLSQLMFRLQHWQNQQQHELTRLFMQSAKSGEITLAMIAAAWLYGILHAAGPGHGKALINTWALTQREKLLPAILTASGGALLQAISALLWVSLTIGIANWLIRDSLQQTHLLTQTGNLLIIGAGIYLLLFRHSRQHRCGCHGHAHHEHNSASSHADHTHPHPETPLPAKPRKPYGRLAIILGIGIRPCSGALLILAIAASRGMWGTGIAMTLAMAAGTAITISLTAILTVTGRNRIADKLIEPHWYPWISRCGGLLLLALGLLLFIAAWGGTSTNPLYQIK